MNKTIRRKLVENHLHSEMLWSAGLFVSVTILLQYIPLGDSSIAREVSEVLRMKPIAQILREKARLQQQQQKQRENDEKEAAAKKVRSLDDLEKQIEELQKNDAEEEEDSSSGESDSEDDGEGDDSDVDQEDSLLYERDAAGNIIRIISSLAKEESIKPLPASYLPAKRCNNLSTSSDKGNKRRKISFADERNGHSSSSGGQHGFLRTVKEAIDSYVPASHEKLPFHCRVCKFQGQNLEEFEAHRASEEHKVATSTENKICFCKLCRKKFTSPAQLSEHLKGKGHKERLEYVKSAHEQRKRFV